MLEADGFTAVALEITDDAQAYHEVAYPERCVLVLGNEDHGITRPTLACCPVRVYVPMLGRGRSLNVSMAAAVVAYRIRLSSAEAAPTAHEGGPNTPAT